MEGHIIRIPSPSASAPPPSPPVPPAPSAVAPQEPQLPLADYLMQAAADFMWNDLTDTEEPEHADAAGEEPHEDDGTDDDDWVDVPDGDAQDEDLEPNVQPGGLGMEADLGLDADAMDDMEDFEGIMELLGMRGPITNLFQNVIFCAVLVQSALVACVFGPFNTGRLSLWILAKPVRLVRIVFEFSKLLQDLAFIIIGFGSWMLVNIIDIFTARIGGSLAAQVVVARKGSWAFFVGAASRVVDFISFDASSPGSGIQNWSAISRQALISIKQQVSSVFCLSQLDLGAMLRPDHLLPVLGSAVTASGHIIVGLPKKLMNPDSWVIEFSSERNATVDLELASWSAADISWAILAGYATIFLAAALYMKSGIKFSRGTVLEDWETGLIDSLHQASGILKVITIIGIEMLVFPLYCGLLLDCALLPLFTDATFKSRMLFTYNNPWTSVFVHWFVGTGYMFHFALFVSMCRKIMRPGVLCEFSHHQCGCST
jgi:E3 ubiquitin-protein ligase MARCH6